MGRLPICLLSSWGHLGSQSFALGVFAVVFRGNILSMNLKDLFRNHFNELFVWNCFSELYSGNSFWGFIVENWGRLFWEVFMRIYLRGISSGDWGCEALRSYFRGIFVGEWFSVKCFFWQMIFRESFCWESILGAKYFWEFCFVEYFSGITGGISTKEGNWISRRMGTREWSRDLSSCIFEDNDDVLKQHDKKSGL